MKLSCQRWATILVCLSLVLFSSQIRADVLRIQKLDFFIPDNASRTWVLKDGMQNGLETSIVQLSLYGSMNEVQSLFAGQLASMGEYREQRINGVTILSLLHTGKFITVQLKPERASIKAMMMVSDARAKRFNKRFSGGSLPASMSVLNVVQKGGGETATIQTSLSVDQAAHQLDASFGRDGWKKINSRQAQQVNGIQVLYKKRSKAMWVFLASNPEYRGNTLGVINVY